MKVEEVVRLFKGLQQSNLVTEISIFDDNQQYIGKLKPIDIELALDKNIINSLTKWRRQFMHFFMTQFEATPERTAEWLKKVVLVDDTRLLFLVYDKTDNLVGNFGICNIQKKSVELDNIIRGEKIGHKQLFFFCGIALISWLYNELEVDNIYLRVFTNNINAIRLYSSLGFKPQRIFALCRNVNDNGEVTYTIDNTILPDESRLNLTLMELDKTNFTPTYGIKR